MSFREASAATLQRQENFYYFMPNTNSMSISCHCPSSCCLREAQYMRCPKLNQIDASCSQAISFLAPVCIIARVPPIYSLARLNKLPLSLVCTVTRVPPNCLVNIYEILLFRALLVPYDSTNQITTKLLQAPVTYTKAEISSTPIGNLSLIHI